MKLKKWLSTILAVVTVFTTLSLTACGFGQSSSSSAKSGKVIDYGNIVMSCLGDSITDEVNGEKYPSLLQDEYGFKAVNNYAKSGATISTLKTNNLQQQIENVDKDSDIISVLAGVNDFKYASTPIGKKGFTDTNTFYGAVETLIKGLKARCPNAYIFFMTPYKCSGYDQENKEFKILADYANVIQELCQQYKLDCLNLFVNGGFDYNNAMYTIDGLHPLGRFYEEYTAPMVGEFIAENYPNFAKAKMKQEVAVDA